MYYGIYLRYILDLEKLKEMLERVVWIKDLFFLRYYLVVILKRMVERFIFVEECDLFFVGLG